MTVSSSFVDHVLQHLADLGDVSARPMFGGHGIYADGQIFGIIHDQRFYLKVDDQTRPRYEALGGGPFQPNDRQTIRSYHEVPTEVFEDPDSLLEWARRALKVEG